MSAEGTPLSAAGVNPLSPAPSPRATIGSTNENPRELGFWQLIGEDFRTHDRDLFDQGFWAVATHRLGNWRMGIRFKPLRAIFTILYRVLFKVVQWMCGITLPYTVRLGRRVRIWHHGGMVLHAESIGDDVHVRQNTTFGIARREELHQLPVIEDRCDIAAGVCILGAVRVGHDSVIGANAVVIKDVPPFSVAVGVPAKVIKSREPQRHEGTKEDTKKAE